MAKLRQESTRREEEAKAALARGRDAELAKVIDRLQAEAKREEAKREDRAARKLEEGKREWAERVRAAKEAEAAWMDKYMVAMKRLGVREEEREREGAQLGSALEAQQRAEAEAQQR